MDTGPDDVWSWAGVSWGRSSFSGRCNHALFMRPGHDPLLDTVDKKRRLGLHILRLLR
jgi:hypothetical protein